MEDELKTIFPPPKTIMLPAGRLIDGRMLAAALSVVARVESEWQEVNRQTQTQEREAE